MSYPEIPGYVPDNESSYDGALHAANTREAKQQVLFGLIEGVTPRGHTCDELELITGWPHQTVSARLRDLVLANRIHWTGDRRLSRYGIKVRVYNVTGPDEDGVLVGSHNDGDDDRVQRRRVLPRRPTTL